MRLSRSVPPCACAANSLAIASSIDGGFRLADMLPYLRLIFQSSLPSPLTIIILREGTRFETMGTGATGTLQQLHNVLVLLI